MQGHFQTLTNDPWPEAVVQALVELWAEGVSAALIAAKFGKTRNAVLGKVDRMGLPYRETTRAAAGYNRPPSQLGRKRKPRPPSPETIARFATIAARQGAVPVADMAIPHEQRKTLLDLTDTCCRWPVGDPAQEGFFFCGGVSEKDSPYCPSHARRAYA